MKQLDATPDEERLVRIFRALGNPMRFRILQTLHERQACVCGDIVDLLPLAQSTVSEHLKVLREAGLIQGTVDGPATCYCTDPATLDWWRGQIVRRFGPEPRATTANVGPYQERGTSMTATPLTPGDAIREAVSARYAESARRQLATLETGTPAATDAACCAPAVTLPQPHTLALLPLASADADACCATDAACTTCGTGYSAGELAGLPASVTGVSLGCGAPVGLADVRAGETVLDLGSGGGIDCFLAARAVGPEGRVIGVDMTPDMVRLARANARETGAANVEFRLGEIEHLPVESGMVDLVISNCVINLAPDKEAVFREAARVLRPGGRMVVSDIVAGSPVPNHLRARLDLWGECASGALDRAAYLAALRQAGFAPVEVLEEHDWQTLDEESGVRLLSLTFRAVKA